MDRIFAGIHIKDKASDFLSLDEIDFQKNVFYLKEKIAGRIGYDANKIELIYRGGVLEDDMKLVHAVPCNATVHCFGKTTKYVEYKPSEQATAKAAMAQVQDLFNATAHIQINVNLRVNILQKILVEYPEFRRNLGAQALIRDSVLFNTLHQPDVINNISKHYPIICEAAPFIVDTIKKELTRSVSNSNFSEQANDSTNSSEEETSMGGTSTSNNGGDNNSFLASNQTESGNIRMITRQQLQNALLRIRLGSVNSLSNIAQRNTDLIEATFTPLPNSSSGDRISSNSPLNSAQRDEELIEATATPLPNSPSGDRILANPLFNIADRNEENSSGGDRPSSHSLLSSAPRNAELAESTTTPLSDASGGDHISGDPLSSTAPRSEEPNETSTIPLANSSSGERISPTLFRSELQRAVRMLAQSSNSTPEAPQQMDTSESEYTPTDAAMPPREAEMPGTVVIPAYYRSHKYAEQLRIMVQMGFTDCEENITLLNITNGNIESAINLIVGSEM